MPRFFPLIPFVALSLTAQAPALRPEVQAFVTTLAEKHKFDPKALTALLAPLKPDPEVQELVTPANGPKIKHWRRYRARFVDRVRIRQGVAFWRTHAATLARAEKTYGVPAEIIVAILGVETLYGREMGRFPVLPTLATLTFDYPEAPVKARRSAMFRGELEAFLLLCRDTQQDPMSFQGSYTGAIGIPQFLPSSIRSYAVDFDGDGRIDLRQNPVDAIGSVGSFLKAHGWEAGRPIVWNPVATKAARKALATKTDGDAEAKWRLGDLMELGIAPAGQPLKKLKATEADTRIVLVDLPTPKRPTEYLLGLKNFYVLTRYNRSFFYATSLVELSRVLKRQRR